MARKRHLLEALTEHIRIAAAPPPPPPPPRPKKEHRSERRSRATRRPPLSIPAHVAGIGVLGCIAAIAVAYWIGVHSGTKSPPKDAEIVTRAPDPLSEIGLVPKTVAAPAEPSATLERRHRIQVITYDDNEKNRGYATETMRRLKEQRIPDVMWWSEPPKILVTAGSFASKDDPALVALLRRVRALPSGSGKGEAPFASALVRQFPEPPAFR